MQNPAPAQDGPADDAAARLYVAVGRLVRMLRRTGTATDADLVERLVARLPEREREIVRLRFYQELSQSEIAERVGISQMHVSRLLRRSFEQMRRSAEIDDDVVVD